MSVHGIESIRITTDGACKGNPGPGAYAIIGRMRFVKSKNLPERIWISESGRAAATTNNAMEVIGIVHGLQEAYDTLKRLDHADIGDNPIYKIPIEVRSDSDYAIKGASSYMKGWIARGWRTTKGERVLNLQLWLWLHDLLQKLPNTTFTFVKGHNGDVDNERCDRMASATAIGTMAHKWDAKDALDFKFIPQVFITDAEELADKITDSTMRASLCDEVISFEELMEITGN